MPLGAALLFPVVGVLVDEEVNELLALALHELIELGDGLVDVVLEVVDLVGLHLLGHLHLHVRLVDNLGQGALQGRAVFGRVDGEGPGRDLGALLVLSLADPHQQTLVLVKVIVEGGLLPHLDLGEGGGLRLVAAVDHVAVGVALAGHAVDAQEDLGGDQLILVTRAVVEEEAAHDLDNALRDEHLDLGVGLLVLGLGEAQLGHLTGQLLVLPFLLHSLDIAGDARVPILLFGLLLQSILLLSLSVFEDEVEVGGLEDEAGRGLHAELGHLLRVGLLKRVCLLMDGVDELADGELEGLHRFDLSFVAVVAFEQVALALGRVEEDQSNFSLVLVDILEEDQVGGDWHELLSLLVLRLVKLIVEDGEAGDGDPRGVRAYLLSAEGNCGVDEHALLLLAPSVFGTHDFRKLDAGDLRGQHLFDVRLREDLEDSLRFLEVL
mmetsp:Transcript_12760/g.21542  ORF Transcript_12760/g.21542 Transcript_12760/m.21542 type:complete len:437 (-) Transcript_12760:90-1400(-)